MNSIKILSCITTIALALGLQARDAHALPPTVSCGTAIDEYFTGVRDGDWLSVVGTRLTVRADFGFSSFTMQNGYNLSTNPIGTVGASNRSTFTASKGASHYAGPFSEVFPGRGGPDVDRWDFWVYRSGALWVRSITYGGAWMQLQSATCYRGAQNQTVVRGSIDVPGYGTDFWTFVLVGDALI